MDIGPFKEFLTKWWKQLSIPLALLLLFFAVRFCSNFGKQPKEVYRIARDTTWYPFDLKNREANMVGFTNDLFNAISELQDIRVKITDVASQTLLFGLDKGLWDGALTSLAPQFNQQYVFSDPFYISGLTIIVRSNSDITDPKKLKGALVSIPNGLTVNPQVSQYEAVFIPYTSSATHEIEQLLSGRIDGVLMDFHSAKAYEQNFYVGKIRILINPIVDSSLRLAMRRDDPKAQLIERFNRALKLLQEDGSFNKMLIRWNFLAQ